MEPTPSSEVLNNESKINKFVRAITAYAEEQRGEILQETETYKKQRLQKAEQEALDDVYHLIQKEMTDMRADSVREISRRELDARRDVLAARRTITDKVFALAEEKLALAAAGPDYAARLQAMLRRLTGVLPAGGSVYFAAERDGALLDGLRPLLPEGSALAVTPDIRLGGLRGVNEDAGMVADCTYDAALEDQRDWFMRESGLGTI